MIAIDEVARGRPQLRRILTCRFVVPSDAGRGDAKKWQCIGRLQIEAPVGRFVLFVAADSSSPLRVEKLMVVRSLACDCAAAHDYSFFLFFFNSLRSISTPVPATTALAAAG
ncbi:MAG: hypothetical protein HKN64_03095 [Woeseiaceae bacterium]|nr:hypothetical protein [Woeseiaceae bacterium]